MSILLKVVALAAALVVASPLSSAGSVMPSDGLSTPANAAAPSGLGQLEGPLAFLQRQNHPGFPSSYSSYDAALNKTTHPDAASAIGSPTAASVQLPPLDTYGPVIINSQCLQMGAPQIPSYRYEATLAPCSGSASQMMMVDSDEYTISPYLYPQLIWAPGWAFHIPDRTNSTFSLLPQGLVATGVSPTSLNILTPGEGDGLSTNEPTITGKGEPGVTVTVSLLSPIGEPSGATLCTTTVDPTGAWECTTAPLLDGVVHIGAMHTDANNIPSADRHTFHIDAVNTPVRITTPTDGETIALNAEGYFSFGGDGDTQATVILRDATGAQLCTDETDYSGKWLCAAKLPDGPSTITAEQTTSSGQTSIHTITIIGVRDDPDSPLINFPAIVSALTHLLTPAP
ncbi:hypothetical protein [Microbacterium oxydans]|uniref:hypothetical protein n=1 Tax=Microbacterium oxydans TaxID=82380 RepID=UPI00226B7691|nr:hypothetical protein [Microbacterium oxydans]WAA65602.1 hypothetical protein MME74_15410 [Microbacterium oxydans]